MTNLIAMLIGHGQGSFDVHIISCPYPYTITCYDNDVRIGEIDYYKNHRDTRWICPSFWHSQQFTVRHTDTYI
jgi:hypothetical protein